MNNSCQWPDCAHARKSYYVGLADIADLRNAYQGMIVDGRMGSFEATVDIVTLQRAWRSVLRTLIVKEN